MEGQAPASVLAREFGKVVPLGPDEDGWPAVLLVMPGSCSLTVLWWDELEREPANDQ